MQEATTAPRVLIAELTHRSPLAGTTCLNPRTPVQREDELETATWMRVFEEAAALGVWRVHLCGGEPGMRRDLVELTAVARESGLRTTLITPGVGIKTRTLRDLWEAGLHQVQVSLQDADAVASDKIAGVRGAFQRQHAFAAEAVRLGLPLTISFVVHRADSSCIGAMVERALALKAERIEIASAQDVDWAGEPLENATAEIERLRSLYRGRIAIEAELSNDPTGRSQACAGGSSNYVLTVTPSGNVLPGRDTAAIPGRPLWNIKDHALADIWAKVPALVTRHRPTPSEQPTAASGHIDAPCLYRR